MKSIFNKLLLFSICLCSQYGFAQNYDPLELVKKVMSKDTLANIKKYSKSEYQGHPNGADINPKAKVGFNLLEQNAETAVVNVTLTDSIGKEYDCYFHLKKDTIWKVCAFRALAMTGIIEQVNTDLKRMTSKQIDSVIKAPKIKGVDKRDFKSIDEYQVMLGNTGLTIASDNELIAHFNKNRNAFENLKDNLIKQGIMTIDGGTKEMKNIDTYKKIIQSLFLSGVSTTYETNKKNLNFLIGGILDNTVGYLYVQDEKNLPKVSPSPVIMLRKIAKGWYLYKTT